MPEPAQPFPRDIVGDLEKVREQLPDAFAKYFDPTDGYAGRLFEQMIQRSEPDDFTPWDVVAVSTLSVNVPPRFAAELLLPSELREQALALLRQMPGPNETLADADPSKLLDKSHAGKLYKLFRKHDGMGPTTTSKLLAAKRPELIPIRDSVVENALEAGKTWWAPMQALVRDPRLRELIHETSAGVVGDEVGFLRRVDVAIWMYGSGNL